MPTSAPHIYLPLDFNQLFELVKQLPDEEKQQLIALLQQEQEEHIPIPAEHKKLVRGRVKHYKQHPEKLVDWETAKKRLKLA